MKYDESLFKPIDENVNAMNLNEYRGFYNYAAYHELVESVVDARNISVFANYMMYKNLKYEGVKPFDYQWSNVGHMLNKFEGKGIFGDQVGMGKTIQALLTAYIMFQEKEITNCVIAAPPNLLPQWAEEITTKFKGLFNFECKEGEFGEWDANVGYKKLVEDLANEEQGGDKLCVYFVSTKSLANASNIGKEDEIESKINQLNAYKELLLGSINTMKIEIDRRRNSEDYAEDIEAWFAMSGEDADIRQCSILKDQYDEIDKTELILTNVESEIKRLEDRSLYHKGIGLLIIDEADLIVNSYVEKMLARKTSGKRQVSDEEKIFEGLIKIKSKYSILISATPLKSQLDDVYYLIKLVDGDRFSTPQSFYNYVNASSLAELASKDESLSKLNGLINTMFTRSRMCDEAVTQSYMAQKDIADFIKPILDERYPVPEGFDRNNLELLKKYLYTALSILGKRLNTSRGFNTILEDQLTRRIPAIEKVLISGLYEYCKKTCDVSVHPYIDWSRKRKSPSCYNINNDDNEQNKKIMELLADRNHIGRKIVIFEYKLQNREALYKAIKKAFPDRRIYADINDRDFIEKELRSAKHDLKKEEAEIKDEIDEIDDVIDIGANSYDKRRGTGTTRYKAFKSFNAKRFAEYTVENSDAIYLIDQTRTEGANLNSAAVLMLCQMAYGPTLIDPLRFEQLVGRLNRVGQMDTIRVDIFVDSPMEEALYDIYQDDQGLDMLGNGNTEVSFATPIITEYFRGLKNTDKRFRDLKKNATFVDIFKYCYEYNLTEFFKEEIRRKCDKFRNRVLGDY